MKAVKIMISVILGVSALILGGSFYSNGHAQSKAIAEKPAIVFDLGGVVFDTNRLQFVCNELGMYALFSKNLKRRWYNVLQRVSVANNHFYKPYDSSGNPLIITDHDGDQIPDYMGEWMCGNRSSAEIQTEIITTIKKNPQWFGAFEKKPITRMTRAIFTPERFAASRVRIESIIKLAKKLKKQGHPIYVLSNWDAESFAIMREKHADFFDLLNGWVISGEVHKAKPSPDIYELLMQKYPHDCYCFIDDQQANIDAATACGWCTIKTATKKPDIKLIKHEIATLSKAGNERIA